MTTKIKDVKRREIRRLLRFLLEEGKEISIAVSDYGLVGHTEYYWGIPLNTFKDNLKFYNIKYTGELPHDNR